MSDYKDINTLKQTHIKQEKFSLPTKFDQYYIDIFDRKCIKSYD